MDKPNDPAGSKDRVAGPAAPGTEPQRKTPAAPVARVPTGTNAARTSGATARYGLLWLRRRSDFQRVSKGMRLHTPAFVLQGARQGAPRDTVGAEMDEPARFGLTVSKRNGNAVRRNRIRRRLRAALVRASADLEQPTRDDAAGAPEPAIFAPVMGFDYVIVARPAAIDHPFAELVKAVRTAVRDVHKRRGRQARGAQAGAAQDAGGA